MDLQLDVEKSALSYINSDKLANSFLAFTEYFTLSPVNCQQRPAIFPLPHRGRGVGG